MMYLCALQAPIIIIFDVASVHCTCTYLHIWPNTRPPHPYPPCLYIYLAECEGDSVFVFQPGAGLNKTLCL